uniref:Uncharacterized protein n=1 Tax=Strombidium rassoulzadegani TaxID=1082188 RepID=A0A7S3CKD3_9SPIT|mmetsp:Transcript_14078/g.23910  ORF Transcript_14078/g.23910 Transcript_14078/m.23910 type:complete len:170 (+) Transcript_14078:334-843(+)
MKKYDQKEKAEKQNEEFVKVLKKDDKLLNFFIENYQPGADQADDEKYISYEFSKFSEQGWSDDGQPLGKQVLSKKKALKFAQDVVKKWKGFDLSEQDPKGLQKKLDSFLKGRFDKSWRKFDQSKQGTGMIDMMEAHEFIRGVIPKADQNAVSMAQEEDIINQLDKTGMI